MTPADRYHQWIEWSDEDSAYLGKCPDLRVVIHGPDPAKLYAELREVVEEIIGRFEAEGQPLPSPRVRPMKEIDSARTSLSQFFRESPLGELDLERDRTLTGAKAKREAVVKALVANRQCRLQTLAESFGTLEDFMSQEDLQKVREKP